MKPIRACHDNCSKWPHVALPIGQITFLLALWGVGIPLITLTSSHASFPAIMVLCFASFAGLLLCHHTQLLLRDPSLKVLGYFWLFKLGITLFLLFVGWIPQLDPATSSSWGYDPQRYYMQAQELIENHWIPDLISLKYVGILYYYGAIFYVLGHSPVVSALLNACLTLIAALYIVKVGYEIKGEVGPHDWVIAFVLLLPEMLWFDVLTSRETLISALLIFALLTAGRFLAGMTRLSISKVLIIVGLSTLGIAAVRTSMVLAVFAAITIMMLLLRTGVRFQITQKIVLAVLVAGVLAVGPLIAESLGGYDFEIEAALETAVSGHENIAVTQSENFWGENSIGALLIPEGFLESVIFLPPRMVLYLVAPLPKINVTISGLMAGYWVDWQTLFTLLGSIVNVLLAPYALASLLRSIRERRKKVAPLVIHIAYWMTFVAVAGGNLILHERYRVMAVMLFWVCAWLGARTCTKTQIYIASLFWYGLLTMGALFYLSYKLELV